MNIVVDTSVWSLVLRRPRVNELDPHVATFRSHVEHGTGIHLVGNILQELLDGVKGSLGFERLVKAMEPFPILSAKRSAYILASKLRNDCRAKGVQASPGDFIIAATCIENGYPLLTSDGDFSGIAKHSELTLLETGFRR